MIETKSEFDVAGRSIVHRAPYVGRVRYRMLLVAALVLAACAGSEAGPVPTSQVSSPPSVPDLPPSTGTTESGATTTTVASSEDATTTTGPASNPERALAPDFSLTLSDGSQYQLANETRPVYLVFWAEW